MAEIILFIARNKFWQNLININLIKNADQNADQIKFPQILQRISNLCST